MSRLLKTVLVAMLLCLVGNASAATRLFILSGQSNMAALDPAEVFTPALHEAFADDEVVVVKHALNGQLIRKWVKDWLPPEGEKPKGGGKNGKIYDDLMTQVSQAMEGKPTPDSVVFVWMQGEADGNHVGYGELYTAALESLLDQLHTDLGRTDIGFVLGRISDYGLDKPEERPSWTLVREAQVAFAEQSPGNRRWVDTDDLNDLPNGKNGLHLRKSGYAELGKRFAEASIALANGQ